MTFTIYQIIAFVGGLGGMAVAIAIGYSEGARSSKQHVREQLWELKRLQHEHRQLQLDHEMSRRDAALAIEQLTEERDTALSTALDAAASLQLRLITAHEQLEALQAQQPERAA